jgi:hypothetical protein
MSKIFLASTAAVLSLGAILAAPAPAQAQVGIEFGPRGPRVGIADDRPYRPVIERRERRVIVDDDEENCRVVVRRSRNEFGDRVVRRTRVCD